MEIGEQGVGVGQPAESVEGDGVLAVGLAGDPAGVACNDADEHENRTPSGRHQYRLLDPLFGQSS